MKTTALRIPLILAAFTLSGAASAQEDPLAVPDVSAIGEEADPLAVPDLGAPEPAPELKSLADSCSAHKFETVVRVEGRSRGSRVRICGEPGQTDADWLKTLRSSMAQAEENPDLSLAVREQIVAALKAEIARLEGHASIPVISAPGASIALLPESLEAPSVRPPEYSTLPPLPTPKRTVGAAAKGSKLAAGGSAAIAAPEPVVRPRVTIRCAEPREAFVACARLERESQLLIRADEDLADGISLRFLRGGDNRAELDFGSLMKGDVRKEKLPGRVCAGVMRGKVQVQILRKDRVADTLGPYNLYCGS